MVAVKDRKNALKNPYAHLHLKDISIEKVKESPMLWDPLHYLESCPSSDGAAAVVLGSEAAAKKAPPSARMGHRPREAHRVRPVPRTRHRQAAGGRRLRRELYKKAGITNPLKQVDCAELYVPFSWYEPMWLEGHLIVDEGEGWKVTDRGDTEIGGAFPVNMSGGVLVLQPHRRVGSHPLSRGGQSGAGHRGRLPGRRGQGGHRPRLRRRGAVLRHVDRQL